MFEIMCNFCYIFIFQINSLQTFRMPKINKKEKQQLDKICRDFIRKGNAFYHPETRKLSFILDGYCIKSECFKRTADKVNRGFGVRKIVLPRRLQTQFKTYLDGECQLPGSKIGQVVICLDHFLIEHQKFYLHNGFLPLEAKIQSAKPLMLRDEEKGLRSWIGYKVAVDFGLPNKDWVNIIPISI